MKPSKFADKQDKAASASEPEDSSNASGSQPGSGREVLYSEETNRVLFFIDEVLVEKSSADSAQSVVFFGREALMMIRVVLKQYAGQSFRSIFREIKIFTLLETLKKNNLNVEQNVQEIVQQGIKHDGLPELLGYKIKHKVGEILMTHGGECLETWMERLKFRSNRIDFMVQMLH